MNSRRGVDVDILFYVERSLHLPYLEPIHDYFQYWYPELHLAFFAPTYQASHENMPGWGLEPEKVERLQEKSLFLQDHSLIRPRVNVVADSCYYNLPRQGKVVNVGHTLTCKGMYYRRDPVVRRENLADLLCVPGTWHKNRLLENVFTPIRATGFIKGDELFGPHADDGGRFYRKHDIASKKNVILFAPTFNPELSAIPYVWDKITTLGDAETVVGVKLHPMTPLAWQNMYHDLARDREDVLFLDDDDYSGMMHAADVIVSDASSMFVEFMLLNKPVVLFNNPEMKSFENYHSTDIEHEVRDAVLEAETVPELRKQVDKALKQPDFLEEKRQHYIEALDAGHDGKSAQRAAEAIRELLRKPLRSVIRPRYSVVLELDQNHSEDQAMEEVVVKSGELPVQILTVNKQPEVASGGEPMDVSLLRANGLSRVCEAAQGNFIVLLQSGWALPPNWLKWMENHFHWNRKVGMVKALSDPHQVRHVYDLLFSGQPFPTDNEELTWGFRTIGIGSAAFNDRVVSPCVMLPKPVLHALASQLPEGMGFGKLIRSLDDVLIRVGYLSVTSLETYCFEPGTKTLKNISE